MSEKTLDKLIATLKTEAIEAAEKQAAAIEEEARAEASRLVNEARERGKQIVEEAETTARQTLENGQGALRQAARDVSVSLQNDLLALFGALLERELQQQFSAEVIKEAIVTVVKNVGSGAKLALSPDLQEGITAHLQSTLQTSTKLPELAEQTGLSRTVTIAKQGEGWSYQISPETVSELLKSQLSNRWVEILKGQ